MSEKPTTEQRIAANLKAIREDLGMSQDQVATAMSARGYSWHQATVHKVENGGRQVQLGEGEALAQVFNVPLQQMISSPERAVATVRLVNLGRDVDQRRSDLVAARDRWEAARAKLAAALADPWTQEGLGPLGVPAMALNALSRHEQERLQRWAGESVSDVFESVDNDPWGAAPSPEEPF